MDATIKLNIKGQEIELTTAEAAELHETLARLVGPKATECVPYYVPSWPRYKPIKYVREPNQYPITVWCDSHVLGSWEN